MHGGEKLYGKQTMTLGGRCRYNKNHYSLDGWKALEESGIAFLPAAGARAGTKVFFMTHYGGYWTSSRVNDKDAYRLYFFTLLGGNYPSVETHTRWGAFCIRAVQDVKQ